MSSKIRLLVCFANYTDRLSYYDDWLEAFKEGSRFEVVALDLVRDATVDGLRKVLANVDAVVLLHSTNGDTVAYLEPYAQALGDRSVPLITFVGNEVNLPGSPISEKRRVLSIVQPDILATQLLREAGEFLFGDLVPRVVSIPHALNPASFKVSRPIDARPIDIGARAAKYLPHLGDDDRNRVLAWFSHEGPMRGLSVDISSDRLDRVGWGNFLNACKGTVASEAGSWFLERDDVTVNAIRNEVLAGTHSGVTIRNDSALRKVGHMMPWWARRFARHVLSYGPVRHESLVNESIDHSHIFKKFFQGRVRPEVYGKCISSRHFDAAGTKTCQILLKGRYNDILRPDEHYLALEPDFSNASNVILRFKDTAERQRVANACYELAMSEHTYAHRVRVVGDLLASSKRR